MKKITKSLFSVLICCSFVSNEIIEPSATLVSVKIIEEPVQFLGNINLNSFGNSGLNSQNQNNQRGSSKDDLKLKYKASNFSGPIQLEELNGKCFNYLYDK